MKNKGFTLIELLAVIVILAIIALIATPIILNIIDETKDQSVKRSIDHYMSAVTNAIAGANLNNIATGVKLETCGIEDNGNKLNCGGTEIPVEVDGDKPKTGGRITFQNGKITQINLTMPDGNTYKLDTKGNVVLVSPGEGTETPVCTITQADSSKYTTGDVVVCSISGTTHEFYVIEDAEYTETTLKMLTKEKIFLSTSLSYVGTENGKTITDIINDYVTGLKNGLEVDISGALITKEQIKSLCGVDTTNYCTTSYSWLNEGPYWLGYSNTDGMVMIHYTDKLQEISVNAYGDGLGVRPVITLPTANIQK